MKKSFFLICLVFSSLISFAKVNPPRAQDDNLTREFAKFRKSQIESVDYDLNFSFDEKSQEFTGRTVIEIELKKMDQPLTIDFLGKKISSLKVNGQTLGKWTQRNGSFDIPTNVLKKKTKLEVEYVGAFSTNGHGVQRSVDPEDQNVYIYSDSEPYYAHTLFPCFDQPDLKARYTTTVTAPKKWKVISNELIADVQEDAAHVNQIVRFQKTPLLSTYLYFIGTGAFEEWIDKSGPVPVYLYARKTLAKYVDAPRIFETVQKGLKFFGEFFGTPYPFSKYGQVFIPEFVWGGMENPGAITLNEMGIYRGPVTRSQYEGRDDLMLHEMAHMWFGDLVTMNWWDDLWLNESFATYMSEISSIRAMKAQGALLESINSKGWGYWQDQLPTTHPIETLVKDTRDAKGNFDGITYSKGGSSLKQLHYYVGEEGFKAGLQSYFKKYAYKNTSRADFIREIALASKKDLSKWTHAWLQTAGPHRVEAKWDCAKGVISKFSIEQSPNASKIYSPHKTKVVLFKQAGEKLEPYFTGDVVYSAASTKAQEFIGQQCPEFVFPNSEDHDYALFSLDPVSLKKAHNVLQGAVDDTSIRLMTWKILGQMVLDVKLPVQEYFATALAAIKSEKDESLISIYLGRHSQIINEFYTYLTIAERDRFAPLFEKAIQEKLAAEKPGSNLQMTYFDFQTGISHSPEGLKRLEGYLQNKDLPAGFKLDQDRRWKIILHLAYYGVGGISDLITKEEKQDPTTQGKRNAYVARVAIPKPEAKQSYWKDLEKKPEQISFSSLEAAGSAFNNWNHVDLTEPFVKPYFETITKMDWKANDDFTGLYLQEMFPRNICSESLLKESKSQVANAKNLTDLSKRYWVESNFALSKCIAIRKFSESQLTKVSN